MRVKCTSHQALLLQGDNGNHEPAAH